VTTSSGAIATTIANSVVTYAKIQNVSATAKVLGRSTAGAGVIEELGGQRPVTIGSGVVADHDPVHRRRPWERPGR
jgi:hypothetical protein